MTKNQKKNLNFLQHDTTTRLQQFALTVAHSTMRVSLNSIYSLTD